MAPGAGTHVRGVVEIRSHRHTAPDGTREIGKIATRGTARVWDMRQGPQGAIRSLSEDRRSLYRINP
ncbi:MAG: hypothetical protein CSA70_09505 [Rhodobacterales bacterium]|nr:MAG: hypothetical protein CSA70_09505 [Rhodobacterales bacterium]